MKLKSSSNIYIIGSGMVGLSPAFTASFALADHILDTNKYFN